MIPEMDGEYPAASTLRKIKKWPFNSRQDLYDLSDYVAAAWHWPDFWKKKGRRIVAHTGGWSGNEDIIAALDSTTWWFLCWQSSKRGGNYVFLLPGRKL